MTEVKEEIEYDCVWYLVLGSVLNGAMLEGSGHVAVDMDAMS